MIRNLMIRNLFAAARGVLSREPDPAALAALGLFWLLVGVQTIAVQSSAKLAAHIEDARGLLEGLAGASDVEPVDRDEDDADSATG